MRNVSPVTETTQREEKIEQHLSVRHRCVRSTAARRRLPTNCYQLTKSDLDMSEKSVRSERGKTGRTCPGRGGDDIIRGVSEHVVCPASPALGSHHHLPIAAHANDGVERMPASQGMLLALKYGGLRKTGAAFCCHSSCLQAF